MAQQNGIGFNANQIKVLAIGTMVLDHGASVLLETSSWEWCLRLLGRLTAPVMCFFIAEGYHHTSNLKKYMGRLLLLAVISHVPFHLCFGQDVWAASDVYKRQGCVDDMGSFKNQLIEKM